MNHDESQPLPGTTASPSEETPLESETDGVELPRDDVFRAELLCAPENLDVFLRNLHDFLHICRTRLQPHIDAARETAQETRNDVLHATRGTQTPEQREVYKSPFTDVAVPFCVYLQNFRSGIQTLIGKNFFLRMAATLGTAMSFKELVKVLKDLDQALQVLENARPFLHDEEDFDIVCAMTREAKDAGDIFHMSHKLHEYTKRVSASIQTLHMRLEQAILEVSKSFGRTDEYGFRKYAAIQSFHEATEYLCGYMSQLGDKPEIQTLFYVFEIFNDMLSEYMKREQTQPERMEVSTRIFTLSLNLRGYERHLNDIHAGSLDGNEMARVKDLLDTLYQTIPTLTELSVQDQFPSDQIRNLNRAIEHARDVFRKEIMSDAQPDAKMLRKALGALRTQISYFLYLYDKLAEDGFFQSIKASDQSSL